MRSYTIYGRDERDNPIVEVVVIPRRSMARVIRDFIHRVVGFWRFS